MKYGGVTIVEIKWKTPMSVFVARVQTTVINIAKRQIGPATNYFVL